MTDKYEALKAAALAATPGPWWSGRFDHPDGNALAWLGASFVDCEGGARNYKDQASDATYIAAASPDVVLALIAERDVLAFSLDISAGSIEAVRSANQRLAEERDALAAKVKQMEAQEPYGWTFTGSCRISSEAVVNEEVRQCRGTTKAIPLFTAPGANPDAKDAARYRWLRDTPTGEPLEILELYPSEEIDAAIDAAIGAKK